jgi:hypothetical protein
VLHIALHGLDKVWDLLVPLLKQYIDVRPGAIIVVLQPNQLVVNDDRLYRESYHDQHDRQSCQDVHEFSNTQIAVSLSGVIELHSLDSVSRTASSLNFTPPGRMLVRE